MVGSEVQAWRKACGLTQLGLAQRMGVSERTVQNLESGGFLKTQDQLALDYTSMNVALERRDGSVLTDTALRTFMALETHVTQEMRANIAFGAPPVLSAEEEGNLYGVERFLGRKLTGAELADFVDRLRVPEAAAGGVKNSITDPPKSGSVRLV
jgi:transcriptional regulator with XRE-family HTH domain